MQQVFSNSMLVSLILEKLTSQELLQHRLVCKLWRDEANRLIRRRQQKFFFSPMIKTKSCDNRSDLQWIKSWENALQITFVYSPLRDTFIRATRRFVDMAHPVFDLEASSLDPGEQRRESAFFQEIEDFYTQQKPRTSENFNLNCKTAGFTLDQFTDLLESHNQNQGSDFDDDISIFPLLSYRFECGRLWGRPEIYRFFGALGPKIQYLTVGLNHMCKNSDGNVDADSWVREEKWDHGYEIFKGVPNLQALTIVPFSNLFIQLTESQYFIERELSEPTEEWFVGAKNAEGSKGHEEDDADAPFRHLKCLRFWEHVDKYCEFFARWILLKATSVHRLIFENGVSNDAPPFREEVHPFSRLPFPKRPMRTITTITTLCPTIFRGSPEILENMAQIIDLQHLGGVKVHTLHLNLITIPERMATTTIYNTPDAFAMLKIVVAVAESLEILSLAGGSGVFLEGLLQHQLQQNFDQQEPRLQIFPKVRKLVMYPRGSQLLKRRDFCWHNANPDLNLEPQPGYLTSITTLSKVFPRVEHLNMDARIDHCSTSKDDHLWMAFLPRTNLFLDNIQGQGQNEGHGQKCVDEVTSVKKIHFGRKFSEMFFNIWKFSNLQTLCLDYAPFSRMCSVVWGLTSLETLVINKIPSHGWVLDPDVFLPSFYGSITQGLSKEAIYECYNDLPRTPVSASDLQFLADKRETWRKGANGPSILDLGRFRHLKLFYYLGWVSEVNIYKDARLLLRALLPITCHLTIWVMWPETLRPYENLEWAWGLNNLSHPRLSLRAVRFDGEDPEIPF